MTKQTIAELIDGCDWQDIESAPKDGERILGKKGNLYIGVRWAKRNYMHTDFGWKGWTGQSTPTHWKPIDTPLADALRLAVEGFEAIMKHQASMINTNMPLSRLSVTHRIAENKLKQIEAKLKGKSDVWNRVV